MILIVMLNLVLAFLLARAAFMAVRKYYEWQNMSPDAVPPERALVLDQFIGWTFTTFSKLCFLIGGLILLYFEKQETFNATDPVDWVVPLYLLGFLFIVGRQEIGAYMVHRRYRLFSRERGQ